MKPGTLVLLIKDSEDNTILKKGSVGEVVDCPQHCAHEVPLQDIVVNFPHTPAPNTTTGLWRVPKTWLVPISDPDIDITETEDAPVEETA